jgi:hypothetical protein
MSRVLSFIRESVTSLGLANGLLFTIARALDRASGPGASVHIILLRSRYLCAQATFSRLSQTRIYQAYPGTVYDALPVPPKRRKRFADGAVCFIAARADTLVGS